MSQNVLGGERLGVVDAAVLHRVAHTATGRDGTPAFDLAAPCHADRDRGGLCEVAVREPRPGMEAEPAGILALQADHAVQWIWWDDPVRESTLRRAVYADDRFLLEGAPGPDGEVRAWPSSALASAGLGLSAPTSRELATVEARISEVTSMTRRGH